jgi:ATP-binding protein involved in chromosome partitioning
MGVRFLGAIPIDPQIVECGDAGAPYSQRFSESPAATALAAIVRQIVSVAVPNVF